MSKKDEHNTTEPLAIGDYCQVVDNSVYKDIYVKIIDLPDKRDNRYSVSRDGWAGLRFPRKQLVKVEPSVQSMLEYQEAYRYGI